MSRQNRVGPPGGPAVPPSSPSCSGTGVPTPVAQQAQQYLEDNIKAWMQPSSSARDEMTSLPLGQAASQEPFSAFNHHPPPYNSRVHTGMQQSPSMTRHALQDHNNLHQSRGTPPPVPPHQLQRGGVPQQPPPVTSPSSGYSDSHFALSLACENGAEPQPCSSSAAFPHSLSFGGCSHHSLLQGTSYSTPCGNSPFGITQPSAAASFFARAAQRLNLSSKKKKKQQHTNEHDKIAFRTNFSEVLKSYSPPIPPGLLRNSGRREGGGIGKVKVMLRMCPTSEGSSSDASYMTPDSRKKQVTLFDPTICGSEHSGDRLPGVAAPKMFAFDAVFSPDDNQAEVCSSSLCDVITSVVNGSDGCLFVYGNSKLGKTRTMIGASSSPQELGVVPSAIWWLFKAINEHKHRTGARFSVRVSAVEVAGKVEELRDLLANYAAGTEGSASAPGVYLRDDPVFGTQLMNQSELRAPTAERAAFLLDAALAARTSEQEEDARNAHFLFTLHIYQYRVEKSGRGGVAGGRSRLHLFDLGSCEKTTKSRDGVPGACLSLSALGNVILALFNGQKHVPYKESKLTQLLREAVGSVTCRAAMIAHVSTAPSRYPETLATLQLASRIHRLRRKKLKFPSATDASTGADDRGVCRPFVRIHAVGEDGVKSGSSDPDYTSSSEQSCDTVIFVGSGRGTPVSSLALSSPSPHKKQCSKGTHSQPHQAKGQATTVPPSATNKEDRIIDNPTRSALNSQDLPRNSGTPKKKTLISACYSSPKHQKLESSCLSPKQSSHGSTDHVSDSKKLKYPSDHSAKGSPAKYSSADLLQRVTTVINSTPSSPQSPRRSKRSHKQEGLAAGGSPYNLPHSQQASPASKPITKEPKLASDEMWIDGPRFTKPKFDSRTLQHLQREKWVDGPGLYGYMDVQKETMIRRWVEDHTKITPQSSEKLKKEVWIDFPPDELETLPKAFTEENHLKAKKGENKTEAMGAQMLQEEPEITLIGQNQIQVTVDRNHYAKPNNVAKEQSYDTEDQGTSVTHHKEDNSSRVEVGNSHQRKLQNVPDENPMDEVLRYLESQGSDENSNSSVNLNDNESDDLSHKLRCISENENSTFSRTHSLRGSIDSTTDLLMDNDNIDDDSSDVCDMVDSSIQVTEEDIFSSCGWPDDMSFKGDNMDHPLRILSAEDLNLASSFTDSRAVSIDLDSISVPDTWTGYNDEMDPDLTWRLLRGNSFEGREKSLNENSILNGSTKSDILAAKLERLSRLREIFEKKASGRDNWRPLLNYPKKANDLSSNETRFLFPNKLHHSADSSLEELRENDGYSIHSEPAEYDLDRVDFQFNVQPMNGLRLEAFYNKICKVPQFPKCITQFGKPTQVVPPIVKQPINYSKLPFREMTSQKETILSSSEKLCQEATPSSSSPIFKKRLSGSFRKSDGASDPELNKYPSLTKLGSTKTTDQTEIVKLRSSKNPTEKISTSNTEQINRHSVVEIVHEQRCQMYSEDPFTSSHSPKHSYNNRASKSTKVITEQITNVVRNIEVTELKNESFSHKKHQKKNGSPKLQPRCVIESSSRNGSNRQFRVNQHTGKHGMSPNSSPQHSSKGRDTSCSSGVSNSVSWTLSNPGLVNTPYILQSHHDFENDASFIKNHILSRSTSTPTSPFLSDESTHSWSNVDLTGKGGVPSYACCNSNGTPIVTTLCTPVGINSKKVSNWAARTSSSGHGSDSSAISADMKEAKDLLGCIPKCQQFSGTSSGYESMPRDSESTPHSSSSRESSSELTGKRENRGRKGAKKKSQGSSKRSRSVPARPPIPGSPSWQPLPQTSTNQVKRTRGRLVRDLQDPSLWKSEEDVCCTSLLCCRLLNFYST